MTKWSTFLSLQINQFIYFVNHLSKKQLALLSTFFSLGFLLLLLVNLHLYPHFSKSEKGVEVLVQMVLEEQEIVKKEPEKEKVDFSDFSSQSFESNQSYNTQSKATYSISGQENMLSENPTDASGFGNYDSKLKDLAKKKKQTLDSLKAVPDQTHNAPSNTRVYYSLFEREKVHLPIPVYTCKKGGKVVIDIKVNPEGRVLDAQVNTALSSTNNGCLLENALAYATKSYFNTKDGKTQWGTITYYFQGK